MNDNDAATWAALATAWSSMMLWLTWERYHRLMYAREREHIEWIDLGGES